MDQINEIVYYYPTIFWRAYVYIYSGLHDAYSTDLAYPKEDLDKKLHPMVFDAMCIHIIPSMINQACIEVMAWMRNYIS